MLSRASMLLGNHAGLDDARRLREGANVSQSRMNLGVGLDLEEASDGAEQPALSTAGSSDYQAVVRAGFGRRQTLDGTDDHVAHLV